ncbi:hypothetical protein [Streptomyces sp. NPDC054804]
MSTTTDQAIAIVEEFRDTMQSLGQTTPAVEKFADDVTIFVIATGSPQVAVDMALLNLVGKQVAP